jgi:signal transduction histidine kinase/ActR/RegA family two-component response regulator
MNEPKTAEWLKNIDAGLGRIARILANQDGNTAEAFREITQVTCQNLKASRVSLWLFNNDGTRLFCSDLFDSASSSHHQGPELCDTRCSDVVRTLEQQDAVTATKVDGLDLLSSFVSQDFARPGSVLHGVVKMLDRIAGLLLVEQVGPPRTWHLDEIMLVRATASFAPTLLQAQERIRIEEELKRNLSLLQGTLESTDEGIVVVNLDRTISLANGRFKEMAGVDPTKGRSLEGVPIRSLLKHSVKNLESLIDAGDQLYANPEQQAMLQLEFIDGRIFEVFSMPQRIDGKIVGRIFSYRDITSRINNEQARAKLETQLRHAQKMEAIGTLAGGIAHDFNNILSGIICNLELVRGDLDANHPAQESLDDITIAALRAADLIKQILTFSRSQVPERKSLQLESVLTEALKLIRASIPALIDLQTEIPPDLPTILADSTQIHQVVMNLCTNAWQAIGNRAGIIAVKVQTISADHALIEHNHDLHLGDYLRLSISDTGCGMNAATLERAFDPFFTTKTPDKGTGLGLSVVHGIMRSHEGAIIVDSLPEQGTTFHLYFPTRLPVHKPDTSLHPVIQPGHGESILFVDDEPLLVEAGRRTLERLGYRVTALPSPQDALDLFCQNPNSYDAAVCDLTMPVMTGMELAAQMHTIRPKLPIILVTGNASGMPPQQLRGSTIREILHKPLSAQLLSDALYRTLHQPQSTRL